MKNKLRNINVKGQAFVYWYTYGKVFILNISVRDNKNIRIKLIFDASSIVPKEKTNSFWAFFEMKYIKSGYERCVNLSRPKIVAEFINHLIIYNGLIFNQTKQFVNMVGMLLLNMMGYSNVEPVWIAGW